LITTRNKTTNRDFLQTPLQPLHNNLDSGTYETFERDNKKYEQYELAILRALVLDKRLVEKGAHSPRPASKEKEERCNEEKEEKKREEEEKEEEEEEDDDNGRILIGVLGAGRGPLIRLAFKAAKKARLVREWIIRELKKNKVNQKKKDNKEEGHEGTRGENDYVVEDDDFYNKVYELIIANDFPDLVIS
jgi:protein arginine N-methyltransferase 5